MVSEGVVRIDLERKFVHKFDNLQLEDTVDPELMDDLQLNVDAEVATDLLIDNEENNYSVLREMQRNKIAKGARNLKQAESSNLAQQSSQGILDNNNMVQTEVQEKEHQKAHVNQLVSEIADASEDNTSDLQLQVPLISKNDAVYLGTVYLGSPVSQPAKVVFDTGSEYLAITSVLCDDETAGNYRFKKYDPLSGGFVQRDQIHKRCKTMSYDMHQSDSNKILSKASSKLTYGSAKLQGFIW